MLRNHIWVVFRGRAPNRQHSFFGPTSLSCALCNSVHGLRERVISRSSSSSSSFLKVALCTCVLRTSDELKISIEAARLACPETKDETHLLPLPLFVTIAEFDPADQRVRSGMSVRTEMLYDGKTGHFSTILSLSATFSTFIFLW